jgi:hypothetical protein
MLSKEGGIILPGLAVVLILLLTPGGLLLRIKKTLPVFWLLLPLALYLGLRSHALAPPELDAKAVVGMDQMSSMVESAVLPSLETMGHVSRIWGESLRVLMWPYPLEVVYHLPLMSLWTSVTLHLSLLMLAVIQTLRGRVGLAAGLAVFYISMIPASRIISFGEVGPHIAERYLYFPSLGLVIALAFGLMAVGERFGRRILVLPGLLTLLVLTAIGWDRNADWASDVILFENEYNQGDHSRITLALLTEAHLAEDNFSRIIHLCDRHDDKQERYENFNFHCGVAYFKERRMNDAERTFLLAVDSLRNGSDAHLNLGRIYFSQQRRDDAIRHFELAAETQHDPATQALRRADMIVILYPNDDAKLLQARDYYKEALRLRPQWKLVQKLLSNLETKLEQSKVQSRDDAR